MGGNGVGSSHLRGVLAQLEPGARVYLVVETSTIRRTSEELRADDDADPTSSRLVPAEGGLLPYRTVLGNLAHAHRGSKLSRRSIESSVEGPARDFGLGDVLERFPYELTPGRRRLAGLAKAMCCYQLPRVIVLEDAEGLPPWGGLLEQCHAPGLASVALLLVTDDANRAPGFGALTIGPSQDGDADART